MVLEVGQRIVAGAAVVRRPLQERVGDLPQLPKWLVQTVYGRTCEPPNHVCDRLVVAVFCEHIGDLDIQWVLPAGGGLNRLLGDCGCTPPILPRSRAGWSADVCPTLSLRAS